MLEKKMKNVLKKIFTIKYFIIACTIFTSLSFNTNAATFSNFTVQVGNDQVTANGTSDTISSNLTINGRWFLGGTSSSTDMIFNGTQTLGGTGELIMSDSSNNRWLGDTANTITVGSGLTVRGAGNIGLNLPNIVNNGQILAQGIDNELLIRSNSLTNNGVLRAEGAGGLHISGVNVTNNTSVDVNAGSSLNLTSNTVINGVINVAGTGTARASQTTFDGVTLNGDMQQDNSTFSTVTNGLTLNGAWNLNGTSGTTALTFNGPQSIGGIGEIVMSDSASNRIASNSNALTIGTDTVVRGAGAVGFNVTTLVNDGQILAQGVANELLIRSNSLTNNGVLRAEGLKGLRITSGSFTTNGQVEIVPTSVLNRTGDYIQTNGTTNVDGTLNVTGLTDIQGGRLSGNGQINGTVANSGTVGPGNSPGHMSINGDYSQSIGGTLEAEIGGLVAGTEYDWLDISGQASLSGVLKVALFDSGSGLFTPSLGDTFDILSAASIVGQFDILTLAALGNGLDWDVSYILNPVSTDFVRLSVVSSVPIPPAVWLFGSGLLGLIGVARRKQV